MRTRLQFNPYWFVVKQLQVGTSPFANEPRHWSAAARMTRRRPLQATPANKMWLPVAPQLSVHVNQMIAKAKHHWCNSRIDKCCSLRLIQRQVARELDLVIAALFEPLCVCKCLLAQPLLTSSAAAVCVGEYACAWVDGWRGAVGTRRPRKNC